MYNLLKDNVFRLIEEKGLSVRKVERDLGFGYGTLVAWDKHMPSVDKGVGWVDRRQGSNPCFSAI